VKVTEQMQGLRRRALSEMKQPVRWIMGSEAYAMFCYEIGEAFSHSAPSANAKVFMGLPIEHDPNGADLVELITS
jgi:hypothetical protein